jgi:hypothetical protein
VENENLKKENAELKEDNQALKEENQELEEQMETMAFINEEFAKESRGYKKMSERLMKKQESQKGSEFNSDEERPNPPKPRRIQPSRKAKKKEDSEDESDSKDARAEMKALMKTIPPNLELRVDEVYSSATNRKILNNLVPELLKSMGPRFRPTRKQLHEWLGVLHRHQRGRYRKREMGKLDADNRRLHGNSRLNEVRLGFHIY